MTTPNIRTMAQDYLRMSFQNIMLILKKIEVFAKHRIVEFAFALHIILRHQT